MTAFIARWTALCVAFLAVLASATIAAAQSGQSSCPAPGTIRAIADRKRGDSARYLAYLTMRSEGRMRSGGVCGGSSSIGVLAVARAIAGRVDSSETSSTSASPDVSAGNIMP